MQKMHCAQPHDYQARRWTSSSHQSSLPRSFDGSRKSRLSHNSSCLRTVPFPRKNTLLFTRFTPIIGQQSLAIVLGVRAALFATVAGLAGIHPATNRDPGGHTRRRLGANTAHFPSSSYLAAGRPPLPSSISLFPCRRRRCRLLPPPLLPRRGCHETASKITGYRSLLPPTSLALGSTRASHVRLMIASGRHSDASCRRSGPDGRPSLSGDPHRVQ